MPSFRGRDVKEKQREKAKKKYVYVHLKVCCFFHLNINVVQGAHCSIFLITTFLSPSERFSRVPTRKAGSLMLFKKETTCSAFDSFTTRIMPIPQLNVLASSPFTDCVREADQLCERRTGEKPTWRDVPHLGQPPKDRGKLPAISIKNSTEISGQDAGYVFDQPSPSDMCQRLKHSLLGQWDAALHVQFGWNKERLRQCLE